jgi:hypothetical protein
MMMPSQDDIERVRAIKSRHEQELLQRPNVVGVGIGFKYVNGQPTGEVVLIVNVTEKKPLAELAAEDVIPAELEGIPVDVQEVGEVRAF